MTADEATIFVVDDDAAVGQSLARLLRSSGFKVEACSSAEEFLARPAFSGTGCVILDVCMPGITGPGLHERMCENGLSLPVIFLTGHGDVPTSVTAMKKGAIDFLLKPVGDEVLLKAVRQALSRHDAERAREGQRERINALMARLSPRERDVMEHVIKGRLNKQIAADLGIAEKTVKVHRARLMEKMKASSVAELVHLCESVGMDLGWAQAAVSPREPPTAY